MRLSDKSGIQLISLMILLVLLPIQACCTSRDTNTRAIASMTSLIGSTTGAETSFSIVWITDTQYLSKNYPTYFDSLCRWIVDHSSIYNVKMVVHTGDIVDSEDDQIQWTNANNSVGILLNNGIPYCWDAGNHDFTASYWIGNQFSAFNPALMQKESYWLSDKFDGENTAVHFNVSNEDFLIINIQYDANSTVLNWANYLLDAFPRSHAIVATHAYIDDKCRYNYWATNFRDSVLENHTNVFLTLSGHFGTDFGNRTKVGNRNELMYDRQYTDGKMGAASLRLLTFNISNASIGVRTFVIYANQFLTDSNNQFTLENISYSNSHQNGNSGAISPSFPIVNIALILSLVLVTAVLVYHYRPYLRDKLSPISKNPQ